MAFSTVKASIKSMAGSYSLIIGDEESEPVPYGDVAEIETSDGKRFIAFVEADGENVEPLTEYWAYEVLPIEEVPIVDEDEDEDEDDEDEGDEDEEDEPIAPEPEEAATT